MKVALIHDFLIQDGGAERVLEALIKLYPKAPIFTLVHDSRHLQKRFAGRDIKTSFIQRLPGGVRHYKIFLPLMPRAIESLNLRGYDLVISSASAFAKGVITDKNTVHICYCHTPTRYLWSDTVSYVRELPYPKFVRMLIPPVLNSIRAWDKLAADRPNVIIANSKEVQKRIKQYYKRESTVVYPPVDLSGFSQPRAPQDFYLTGGRLVSYKRFDIVVEAFNRLRLPLKIFGDGPDRKRLEKLSGPTVDILGYVSEKKLASYYTSCRAFIHPQVEDFGITVIEAMAAGSPVVAFAGGGALETVSDKVTGVFFKEQCWESLADAVIRTRDKRFDPEALRAHASKFTLGRFKENINRIIEDAMAKHTN